MSVSPIKLDASPWCERIPIWGSSAPISASRSFGASEQSRYQGSEKVAVDALKQRLGLVYICIGFISKIMAYKVVFI